MSDAAPVRYRLNGHWNPARDAVLRRMWPEGAAEPAILAAVNAEPGGPPVTTPDAVANRAARLRLRRSPEAMLAIRAAAAERARQAAAAGRVEPTIIPPPPGTIGPSAMQEQLIRELWPQELPRAEVMRHYNALGPHEVPRISYLYPIAVRLGVHAVQDVPRSRRAGRKPTVVADAADPLAALPAGDLAEARAMIARRGGWRDLAARFGWEERRAIAIAAALRDDLTRPELAA